MGGSLVFPRPEGPGSFSSLPGLSSPRPERRRCPGDCRRQTGRLSPRERPVLCVDMRNSGWILLLSCFPIRGNRLFCALMPSFAGMRRQATAAFFPYEIFGAGAESPCFTRVRVLGSRTKSTCRGRIPVPGFSFLFLPVVPVERPSLLPCPCRGFGKGREGKAQERRSGRRGENPLLRGSRGRRASFPSPAGGRGKAGRRRRTGRKGGGRGEAFPQRRPAWLLRLSLCACGIHIPPVSPGGEAGGKRLVSLQSSASSGTQRVSSPLGATPAAYSFMAICSPSSSA